MRTMCSREILTKKSRQQQNFDSDLKGAWHYNQVTFTPIAKFFLLYCRLIYLLYILCVTLMIKVKVGIPESFKVGWYHQKITGSSHLKTGRYDNIPRNERMCNVCNCKTIEDEIHFLLDCPSYASLRDMFFIKIEPSLPFPR